MENLDYPFSLNQGWKNGENRGGREEWFLLHFIPGVHDKKFHLPRLQNVSLNLNTRLVQTPAF